VRADIYHIAPSPTAQSNNGMHPARDTNDFINLRLVGGRVMPGVRRSELCEES
jgi:hypothetical protein